MSVSTNENNIDNLIELAEQEASAGNLAECEQFLLRSYQKLEDDKHHCGELRARVLRLLANCYRGSGNLNMARDHYEKACQVAAAENLLPAVSLNDDMYIFGLVQNDYAYALQAQVDLWQSLEKSGGAMLEAKLRNLLRMAALYWLQADYINADKHLREYLQLVVDAREAPAQAYVSVLGYLGLIAFRLENHAEAEALYKEALALLGDITDNEQAELLKQLGLVLCSQNRNREAQLKCRKAEALRTEAGDEISNQLRSIADVYCSKNCFDEAYKYCRAALDVVELGSAAEKNEALALILRRFGLSQDAAMLKKQPG